MSAYETTNHIDDNRRPEDIEEDIERTRADVSSTIDAIQSKLTPGQMMDQALSYARTSLPADFGVNLGNTVRNNPVPVALVGLGLAWLAVTSRSSTSNGMSSRVHFDRDGYSRGNSGQYGVDTQSGGTQGDKLQRATSAVSEKAGEVKDRVAETGHNVMNKVTEIGQRISGSAHDMTNRASDVTSSARARINELGHLSQEKYYRAKDGFTQMLDEQPLMVGVLGLAAGAVLGAALPNTRREDEMLGRARDDLLDGAKELASEQTERVKESAKHVAETVKEEAKSMVSDLTSGTSGQSSSTGATASDTTAAAGKSDGIGTTGIGEGTSTAAGKTSRKRTSPDEKTSGHYDEIPVDEEHM